MPIYLTFQNYNASYLQPNVPPRSLANFPGHTGVTYSLTHYFEALSCSFDAVQTLNIGSSSSGAGAGKVMFNPFVVYFQSLHTFSTVFFKNLCSGTPFEFVNVYQTEIISGVETVVDVFVMGLVAAKEMQPSLDSSGTQWAVSFEFGGLAMGSSMINSGNWTIWQIAGWNRVKNVAWNGVTVIN